MQIEFGNEFLGNNLSRESTVTVFVEIILLYVLKWYILITA